MGRSSTAAERPTTVNISSWGTPEEGIDIDTIICSKPISMLIDTGASVTILSQQFLNTIDPSLKPEIISVNIKMKSATGEISSFLGQIAVELKLGKTLITHKVLIANIPIEGILGMDFL
jgi:predicted aspartyl protease